MPTSEKGKIVKEFLRDNPNLENKTAARIIFEKHNLVFRDVEQVRTMIRYYKGARGEKCLRKVGPEFLTKEAIAKKYDLPPSLEQEYKPFKITGNKGLIFNDVHIPFHNTPALESMLDFTVGRDLDFIIANGDIMDCFEISYFDKEPNVVRFEDEIGYTKQFFSTLRKLFPNAKIYYKFGNHEKRFETYLIRKAPEIYGLSLLRLETLLDLYNLGVQHVPEASYMYIDKLNILHGHEYKKAVSSPANPARTLFLRTKSNAICGHHHQISDHTEPRINGDVITCWSVGCLCELNPKYMPLNKWAHGFALYERIDEKLWVVKNKRIIENKVV